MTVALRSCLYRGLVTHSRSRPVRHRFAYRVFMMLLDLDELAALDRRLWLFGFNRRALFSFRDRDHGPEERPVRDWIDDELSRAGFEPSRMRVAVLCYPRLFGYVFNPLSVFFCSDRDGRLRAVVYEVHNTFGGRHAYVLPVDADGSRAAVKQSCEKAFFVSPFIETAGGYRFRVRPPGEMATLQIEAQDDDGPFFQASFTGRRAPLNDRSLLGALFRYPLMTYRVIGAIHWQALRLWLKGVSFRAPRRAPRPLVRGNLRDAG